MTGATTNSKSATSKAAERELEKLHKQDFWLRIQRTKLLLDLLFVCKSLLLLLLLHVLITGTWKAYEIFKIKPARDIVKPFAGLGAAILR